MKKIIAILLAALMLCSLLTACGGKQNGDQPEQPEEPIVTPAGYSVRIVDALGNPCSEGIIVRFMQNGQQVSMQTVDANGVPQYTDLILKDRDGPSAGAAKYTGCGNVNHCGFQLEQTAIAKNNPIVAEGAAMWRENAATGEHVLPTLVLTAEEAAGDMYEES